MKWVKKEIDFLKANYSKRISLEELGIKMGRTKKSLLRKAQQMKLSRPHYKFNVKPKRPKKIIDQRYYKKNKEKVYNRKMGRRKKLKEEAITLLGGKCTICGYRKCISALEFHHTKGEKEAHVSLFLKNESRQKILKEVGKCILLCANCHREVHFKGL